MSIPDGISGKKGKKSNVTTPALPVDPSQQKAVIDTPPDVLNLMDAFTCQKAAKKAHNATQLNNTVNDSELPKWLQQVLQFQMAAVMMGGPFGGAGIAAGFCAHPELPHTPSPPPTPLSLVPPPMYTPTAVACSPSPTTPKRPADDVLSGPVIFPDLDDLLSSLDSHPICGQKNLNYVQYAMGLMAQGILDLSDLLSLTADKVLELSGPPMNYGTANCLMMFAQEDHSKLWSLN
ncbi:hypothetical protein L208DRAFT_1379625 [Tricholoma matsutake]|nr:hypothetical protein L208DRAFT_1379625 [Tricholoma matsutake 945]